VELGVDDFIVVLVGLVVDDLQDLNEAEGGPQPAQGRLLLRIQLGHGPSRLPPRRLVAPGPEVQVDPAALELEFIVILSRVQLRPCEQQLCVADSSMTHRSSLVEDARRVDDFVTDLVPA
jgi:hypothetical protein